MADRRKGDIVSFPVGILESENLREGSLFHWQEEALGPTYYCEIVTQGRQNDGSLATKALIKDVLEKFPDDE